MNIDNRDIANVDKELDDDEVVVFLSLFFLSPCCFLLYNVVQVVLDDLGVDNWAVCNACQKWRKLEVAFELTKEFSCALVGAKCTDSCDCDDETGCDCIKGHDCDCEWKKC